VAALSAPTGEGELYEVDMRLRPSGTSGPVAEKLASLESYYAGEADSWEFLALSRARVVWASSPDFGAKCSDAIEKALRQARDPDKMRADVADMRALMRRERPAHGFWDLKLVDGGLVDIEFAAQTLQILGAAGGGKLTVSTSGALEAARDEGRLSAAHAAALIDGWRLHQAVSQLLKLSVRETDDPAQEPAPFQALLAQAGGEVDLAGLVRRLGEARAAAIAACRTVYG